MTATTETTTAAALVLQAFDPATLLLDSRRTDAAATVTADFTAQLAAHAKTGPPVPVHGADGATAQCGNHTPIVIVTDDKGRLLVLMGARRTLGCQAAGVPVLGYIAGPEGATKAQMASQVIDQITENQGRVGYTVAEVAAQVGVLFELSVSPAQIAKRTGLPRADVDAAKAVAGSEFAAAAAQRYDLTLEQSAVMAEMDEHGDKDGAAALVAVARDDPEKFAHVAQQLTDSRASRAAKAALAAELEAAGYQVTDRHPGGMEWWYLGNLTDGDGGELTADAHAACPGRAVRISSQWAWDEGAEAAYRAKHDMGDLDEDDETEGRWDTNAAAEADGYRQVWGVTEHYCTGWEANGHQRKVYSYDQAKTKPEKGTPEAEAASAERKLVLKNNRDWRSANETRTKFVTALLTRAKMAKALAIEAARFRAEAIALGETQPAQMGEGHTVACELLGIKHGGGYGAAGRDEILDAIGKASPARREVIELAMILGAAEHGARDVSTWRQAVSDSGWRYYSRVPQAARFLVFLRDHCGYPLSDLEQTVAGVTEKIAAAKAARASDADQGVDTVHLPGDGPGGEGGGEDELAGLQPGDPIPPERTGGMEGFVVGECGHRVAASEWRAGFRNCERCGQGAADDDEAGDDEAGDEAGDGDGPWPGDPDYQPDAAPGYAGDDA